MILCIIHRGEVDACPVECDIRYERDYDADAIDRRLAAIWTRNLAMRECGLIVSE